MGTTLGKTLAVKLSLRDGGGKRGNPTTRSGLRKRPVVPNPQPLLQQLFKDPQLLRKPTAPTEGGLPVKFRCERDTLADAIAVAQRAVASRTGALPVLSGLRVSPTASTRSRSPLERVRPDWPAPSLLSFCRAMIMSPT